MLDVLALSFSDSCLVSAHVVVDVSSVSRSDIKKLAPGLSLSVLDGMGIKANPPPPLAARERLG